MAGMHVRASVWERIGRAGARRQNSGVFAFVLTLPTYSDAQTLLVGIWDVFLAHLLHHRCFKHAQTLLRPRNCQRHTSARPRPW